MILSQFLSGNYSNSASSSSTSSSSTDVLAQVTKAMESRNTVAPKLNAALSSDNTKLSGLGKLLNALTTFQSAAQSLTDAGTSTSTSTPDPAQLKAKITNLVSQYNALNTSLNALRKGDLKSDAALSSVRTELARTLSTASGGPTGLSLTSIGVTAQADGTVAVDEKKLQKALDANPEGVAKLFGNDGKGVADNLVSQIKAMVSSTGSIAKEKGVLNKDITAINAKKAALEKTLTAQAQALAKYYSSQGGASTSSSGTGSSSMPNLFGMLS